MFHSQMKKLKRVLFIRQFCSLSGVAITKQMFKFDFAEKSVKKVPFIEKYIKETMFKCRN